MDLNNIVSIIANNAFPIVMCVLLLSNNKEESAQHKEEVDKLAEVINANTMAVTTLCERLKEGK